MMPQPWMRLLELIQLPVPCIRAPCDNVIVPPPLRVTFAPPLVSVVILGLELMIRLPAFEIDAALPLPLTVSVRELLMLTVSPLLIVSPLIVALMSTETMLLVALPASTKTKYSAPAGLSLCGTTPPDQFAAEL